MPPHTEVSSPPSPQTRTPEPTAAPRRRSRAWVWLLLFGALGFGGYQYYRQGQQKKRAAAAAQAARAVPRSVPVSAAAARTGDMPVLIRGLGSVTPFNTVSVKSRVDGQLIAIHFQEGQYVKAGDPLAEIDPRPFQVQLEQAEGQLARDQAQMKDAQVNLERFRALWEAQVIARQQFDTQGALVGQYQGTIEADKGAIDNARLQLTYAHITAPLSGRVGLRLVDVGNMVHAADPNGLVTIAQMQPIAVLFTIPADNLPPVLAKLRAGVKLRVDAYDRSDTKRIATGTLLTVDNQIDPNTGTSRLKAVFDNTDNALFPNQFVNCRLVLDTQHGAVMVPSVAVARGPQGTYVYVVTPERKAALRVVSTGLTEGNDTVITKGLRTGEMVVTDGQDKLQEGSRVEIRRSAGS